MRYQGRIIKWNNDKGFGFIAPNGGGEQVFVHISAFSNRQRRPNESVIVTFELGADERGRPRAANVAFVGEKAKPSNPIGTSLFPSILAIGFLFFIGAAVLSGKLPLTILWLYLFASAVTFIAYFLDKAAAEKGHWRTLESTLHLFSLVGGWPGALIAQRSFRHKTAKESFQTVFWVTAILNSIALGWLFTAPGKRLLAIILAGF
jgi:uncharacterized membrane protein YsdA (DUF1294 family)/cold shock CspA family protein